MKIIVNDIICVEVWVYWGNVKADKHLHNLSDYFQFACVNNEFQKRKQAITIK